MHACVRACVRKCGYVRERERCCCIFNDKQTKLYNKKDSVNSQLLQEANLQGYVFPFRFSVYSPETVKTEQVSSPKPVRIGYLNSQMIMDTAMQSFNGSDLT